MNTNRHQHMYLTGTLKVVLSFTLLLLAQTWINAQTFNGSIINTAGNSLIPSVGTGGCGVEPQTPATGGTTFNNTVAGLLAGQIVSSVQVNFTHTFDSDIDMFLQAPNGQIIELSTDNGGGNDNYTNTVFADGAPNITTGTPPYTGTFAPEGTLTPDVCGPTITPTVTTLGGFTSSQNGTWQLRFLDDLGGDIGTMLAWSITFAAAVPPCNLVAPAPLTVSVTAGICSASPVVNLPVTNPVGCANGTTNGIRYRIDGGAFMNVALPGATNVTFNNLPPGVHVITWQTYIVANGVTVSTVTQTLTVVDGVPPVITCPGDINITLDPGACSAFVNYIVTATDNCPFLTPVVYTQNPPSLNPAQTLAVNSSLSCSAPPTSYGRVWGGPAQAALTITGLQVGINNNLGFSAPGQYTYNVYRLTSGTAPAAGNANMVLIGGPFVVAMPNLPGTYVPVTFTTPVSVPAGVYFFTEIIASTSYTMGNILAPDLPGTPSYFKSAACGFPNFVTFAAVGFPGNSLAFNVVGFVGGAPMIIQTSGLPSGSQFPIGTTTNCFRVSDIAGNSSTCCFNVTVHEFPNPSTTLACNDNVEVSLDETCSACIDASMILSGDVYGCYDNYIVEIQQGGVWVPACVNGSHVGQTIVTRVTDPATGNSCWGSISVEDKLPPTITCRNVTIMCGQQLPSVPAPGITGYQNLVIDGLNDLLETNSYTYDFDYGYLPSTPVLDVDVRIRIDDHTWLPDVHIDVTSPDGFTQRVFQTVNCAAIETPVNLIFDDAGIVPTLCSELNTPGGTGRIQPLINTFQPVLFNFNGREASGVWHVKIEDVVGGDDGHIRTVGLFININAPQVNAADNCGEVTLSYTDTQTGDPCEELLVTRHWVATDHSGNKASCNQVITVLPLVLDSVDCPPAFIGHCGQPSDPGHTGWPTVNGSPITDENNVCNIFVGYWDKPLNDCGNGEKIVRTWTILDWCTQTTLTCTQVLKFTDDQAPVITCPANVTIGTDFWYCWANVIVPKPNVVDACGSAFTLSLASTGGHITPTGNGYALTQLPLGTHTVTWTATDECGNKSSCSFTIKVVDDVVPVANCDAHTVVALTNDGPDGITLVPASVFDDGSYDNCGGVTLRVRRMESCISRDWTTGGACVDDIPNGQINSVDKGTVSRPCVPFACCDVGQGPIMVELEVTDLAGNRNFCMVEAIVQDKISPFVQNPPDITVSCDFWFNVQEGTFVDGPPDGNSNGNLDEDPLSPVFGNMWDATANNDDESVREDIIINDPGALPYIVPQPHFWGIDGWADDNCEVTLQVRVKVYNDCSGDNFPVAAPPGAVKLIERRFSAIDGQGNVGTDNLHPVQRIWVIDFHPFFITDNTCFNSNPNDGVIWPCDKTYTNCPDDLSDSGEPTVFDDACSLIGVAYEDQRFDFVDGACFKILRTWSIIDWCQYGSDGEGGYNGLWHYIQVIKVHDTEGPAFLNCPAGPQVLCVADPGVTLPDNNQAFLGHNNPNASSCSVHLNLCQTVHETCSDLINYDVKLFLYNGDEFVYVKTLTTIPVDSSHNANLCFDTRQNSNQQIRNNGIPYNSPFCGDYHRLLWSAEDGCGNWSHCEYLIRLEDCKQPSPVCINGLSTVVMPIGGQVTIWAKDFNASSFDDCTAEEDLLYSFSGTSYQPSFTYTCDNVPAFGVELSVNIWVADGGTDDNCNGQISWGERNKDFCTTTIVITDNGHVCTEDDSALAGEVLTEDVQAVEKVAVTLTSPGHVFPTYVTVNDGRYIFSENIILAADYNIKAERNDAFKNGVSTLDLVRIQKHLLGIEPLASPYDLIAADANNSQSVSAIDLVELRKLILGIYSELPANKSWRFVDKSFVFADVTHPWPFDEAIDITNMAGHVGSQDFVAVKVGDVNNSVKANALQVLPRNGKDVVNFVASDRTVNAGEMVDVAISSSDFTAIEGYQFTMQTNGLEFRGVESGLVSMSDENMGVFGSTLTASWHKVGGVSAASSDVLFTLKFQATAAGKLSSMITLNSKETEAEAYNTLDDIKGLKLTFRGAEHGEEFALYQNEPNPFKGNTVIGYDLPDAGKVTLTLFDVTGKVLLVKDKDSVKGYNTISISNKDIPAIGVLYYRLDANEYTATKKMIIIE